MFARPELRGCRDVLFIDEAGQVSLGNLVAMATAAKSLVLVGDQMQLAQPIQGAHPRESGRSGLDHLLEGHAVVPPERGIFLSKTWRMHPDLCRFVSDAVYDGQLQAEASCARQRLVLQPGAHPALKPAGCPSSPSSMRAAGRSPRRRPRPRARSLTASSSSAWLTARAASARGAGGRARGRALQHAGQSARARLPEGARVGTVDKFQGQEAEAVIVSMATSGGGHAARCSVSAVAQPFQRGDQPGALPRGPDRLTGLLDLVANSVDEMRLANLFCWAADYASGAPASGREGSLS